VQVGATTKIGERPSTDAILACVRVNLVVSRLNRLTDRRVRRRVRHVIATELLGQTRSLLVVTALTSAMFLIGVAYYVPTLETVPTVLWPLYADSAVATALCVLSLATVLPTVSVGDSLRAVPVSRPLAYVHTLSFVWLVQFGVWPVVSLNLAFNAYVTSPDAWVYYWGVLGTHLLFVGVALLIPTFGRTTSGALGVALGLSVLNVVVDYGFGYHPPLVYEPGPLLAGATAAIAVGAVWLAHRSFTRVDGR